MFSAISKELLGGVKTSSVPTTTNVGCEIIFSLSHTPSQLRIASVWRSRVSLGISSAVFGSVSR
jgi:hypothetical protein